MTPVTKIMIVLLAIDILFKLYHLAMQKTYAVTFRTMAGDVATHGTLITLLLLGY